MKTLKIKKLKELISEEKRASKMYKSYGFKGIAKDESRHAYELNNLLNAKRKR